MEIKKTITTTQVKPVIGITIVSIVGAIAFVALIINLGLAMGM